MENGERRTLPAGVWLCVRGRQGRTEARGKEQGAGRLNVNIGKERRPLRRIKALRA